MFSFLNFRFFLNNNLSLPKCTYFALEIEIANQRTFEKVTF
jgi:hypothetical protein